MYIIVSPFSHTFDDTGLLYELPWDIDQDVSLWQIVEIPLRDQFQLAVVLSLQKNIDIDYDISKIKQISCIFDHAAWITPESSHLISWMAQHYFTPIHNVTRLFFPKHLLSKLEKWKLELKISKPITYQNTWVNHFSPAQQKAYTQIQQSSAEKILLYGITGSGKTQIYVQMIQDNLKNNKQTLILIPEIILTSQILQRLQDIFWDQVICLHSAVTPATKTKHWIDIYTWNAKIIIGTRSALFYPYRSLCTIIIDEEHDNSYISDQAPRYNSIEVAEKIAKLQWVQLLLWSGTPSVNTMYRAVKSDEFEVVHLLEKYKLEKIK